MEQTFLEPAATHPDAGNLPELWQRLAGQARTPFQQYEWIAAAAQTFCPPDNLRIVTLNDAAHSAIIALVRRWRGGPQLELLSSREMCEPMDALCANRSSAFALADALLALGYPLLLTRMPAESDLVEALSLARLPGRVGVEDAPGALSLDLDTGSTDPMPHFSPKRRADVRHARRHAEALGPVEFEWHIPTLKTLDALLDRAFQIEAHWKGQAGTGRFYRRYAAAAAARRQLHITCLRIGGEYAAMQLLTGTAGRLWLLKTGESPRFARCSPALLLMVETVAQAAANGWLGYEFLGMEEPWLRLWDARVRRCVTLRIYPSSIRNRLARLVDRLVS